MSPVTPANAMNRLCPFSFGEKGGASTCVAGRCMAWNVVHPEWKREDHSGAREHLMSEGVKTGRVARREGGPMSSGFWVLDEVGTCQRLKE